MADLPRDLSDIPGPRGRLTSRVVDAGRQREIEDTVLRLDELADVADLVDLLAAPVSRALD
jgi:hypothetical protein